MEANNERLIERARQQFETHGAPWTDRTEPTIRNIVMPLLMDRDAAILAPAHVRIIRMLVLGAIADVELQRALPLDLGLFIGTREMSAVKAKEALTAIVDSLDGYYGKDGTPY